MCQYKSVAWCVDTKVLPCVSVQKCCLLCQYKVCCLGCRYKVCCAVLIQARRSCMIRWQCDPSWATTSATTYSTGWTLPRCLAERYGAEGIRGHSERVRSAWLCQNMTSFLCNSILPPEMEMKERISTRVVVVVVVARPNSLPALVHVPQA